MAGIEATATESTVVTDLEKVGELNGPQRHGYFHPIFSTLVRASCCEMDEREEG